MTTDAITATVDRLRESQRELSDEIDRLSTARDQITDLIDTLTDDDIVTVRTRPTFRDRLPAAVVGGRATVTPAKTTPTRPTPRQQTPKTCPIAGCGHTSPTGAGLSAHVRHNHPDHAVPTAPAGAANHAVPFTRPPVTSVADAEQAAGLS